MLGAVYAMAQSEDPGDHCVIPDDVGVVTSRSPISSSSEGRGLPI